MKSKRDKVLLLGMVFSIDVPPSRGQAFRDRHRCLALEQLNYDVYTLDNKHQPESSVLLRHCNANFTDARRLSRSIDSAWGTDICFDYIILDYFFSPAGWAHERWTEKFYQNTLPMLVQEGILKLGGALLLPNLPCVTECLSTFYGTLQVYFDMSAAEASDNPLYEASELAESDLMLCPDKITNKNQILPLLTHNLTHPFYLLRAKAGPKSVKVRGIVDLHDKKTSDSIR
jgi:hypothetical protein